MCYDKILRVKDAAGNMATCIATVTVADPIAPAAHCKDATVALDEAGTGTLAAADINNNSTDNCAVTVLELSKDGNTFTPSLTYGCADVGSGNTVTLRVKDAAGRMATCTATVTVVAVVPPRPVLFNPVQSGGIFSVSVETVACSSYILEFKDDLSDDTWTALPPVEGDGTVKVLQDPDADGSQRFYRVSVIP
jgi:hypothetical protein